MQQVEIHEHSSPKYGPRTFVNAKSADLTVAFAVDFTTAGERLTHRAAADRYVGIPMALPAIEAARELYRVLKRTGARRINIAGNGIHILHQHGWQQDQVNAWLQAVLAPVQEHWGLAHVRSGGQTGVDMAGVIAAYALGVDVTLLLPKGYLQRGTDKRDRPHTRDEIVQQLQGGALHIYGKSPMTDPKFPSRHLVAIHFP